MIEDFEEKLLRYTRIESRIYDEYIKIVTTRVDEMLKEKIPDGCGLLKIKLKDKDIVVVIDLLNGDPRINKNFEIDNEYVWSYIVNVKYYNDHKVISLNSHSTEPYETITLGDEFNKELNNLWNNDELKKLENELMENCGFISTNE